MNILDQITESQVSEWMLAKLASLRESDKSFSSISIEARQYKCQPNSETTICIHADEQCVVGEADFPTAIKSISAKLYDDAAKRAASLRKEAEAILSKASELESRSATTESNTDKNEM